MMTHRFASLPPVSVLFLLALLLAGAAGARNLRVGPGGEFATVAAAAAKVQDGDTVEIVAGDYPGGVAVWRANGITIRGVGGRPQVRAAELDAEGKGLWVIKGNDVAIEDVELSAAKVSDRNGAAIRVEGRNLTVRNCFINHNENGILGGIADPKSTLRIENSEFAYNGHGDGQSHGIYIGAVGELTVTGSWLHHARVGHQVKSRAARTSLYFNRIADEAYGNSSYLVDASNGGRLVMVGNLLQQGPRTENVHLVNFGTEGIKHAANEIFLINNTLANLRPQGSMFLREKGAARVRLLNNVFWGNGGFDGSRIDLTNNLHVNSQAVVEKVWPTTVFRNVEHLDFRLAPGSPAVDAGSEVTPIDGIDLRPRLEYVHPASTRPRPVKGPLDMGAFELE